MAENLPSFDDMPDDLPDASTPYVGSPSDTQQRFDPDAYLRSVRNDTPQRPLMFDDLPSFDDMPGNQPQAETFVPRVARKVANTAFPAAASYAGAGVGGEIGAGIGTFVLPGLGTVAGGLIGAGIGALGAGYGASKLQHAVKSATGLDDDIQVAANEEAHPYEQFAVELATGAAGMRPDKAASLIQRGAGAVLGGGMEAGQEYANNGKIDPAKVLASSAVMAALPRENRLGASIAGAGRAVGQRIVPGRPNVEINPAAQPAQDEAQVSQQPLVEGEAATVQTAPPETGDTIGNPQSSPERSDRVYSKAPSEAPQGDILTTGDIDPATAAALLDQLEGKPARQSTSQPSTIRFYHGASSKANPAEYEAWLTPHEDYARNYRGGPNTVHYVDLTPQEAAAQGGIDQINNNRPRNFQANQETSARLQRLPEAAEPGQQDVMPPSPPRQRPAPSAPDPLDMAMNGELTAKRAADVANGLKQHQTDVENEIFGDRADEWRRLHKQSDHAWNSANDAKAREIDSKISKLENDVGLTEEDENWLNGMGWNNQSVPEHWENLSRNLSEIEFGRQDALGVVASEVRYLPKHNDWSKMSSSEQESLITILSAMNAEQAAGRDPMKFLKDAFSERIRRYGGGADAHEVVEYQMQELADLLRNPLNRAERVEPQAAAPPHMLAGPEQTSRPIEFPQHELPPFDEMPARAKDDTVQADVGFSERHLGDNHHTHTDDTTSDSQSPTVRGLMDKLVNDEGGWVDHGKIVDDLKSKLKGSAFLTSFLEPGRKPTKSYIARGVHDDNLSPQEEYARSLSDELYKVRKAKEQHVIDLQKWAASLPNELNNPKTLERMYFAREAGKIGQLDPHEQALYNQHLKPLFDENDRLFDQVSKLDHDMLGPKIQDHIYRITKGASPERNILNPGESADPIEGTHALATRPRGTMLDRKFVALESPEGRRYVISLNHDGFTLWHNRQPMKVVDPHFEYENGGHHQLGHRDFTMKEATTPEIEEHARVAGGGKPEYYHNAALSASAANLDLGEIARHLQFLQDLKSNPEFLKYAKKPGQKAPENYVETQLPNFQNWKMDPQLAYVMDDFAQPGINHPAINRLRQLSQAITKTIFWMPTAHINNVGTHWFVERGFRWLPGTGGYKSLAMDGLKAIKSVVTQDELQKQLRESGAGTIYGGVISRNALDNLARGFGEAVEKNPSKWDPIARQFGVGPSDLVRAVYKASSHVMWAANDMFLTHSVLEHMREGMSMQDAITKAERHIPNYRIPTTVMGSKQGARIFSQLLSEPTSMVFGRYHYGVFNSYANIANDLVRGARGNKLDAIGNLFAMGLLSFAVYPMLDKAAQWITGNDHASAARRGPLAIPYHLYQAARGKENLTTAARDTFTLSPALTTAMQQLSGLDWRGKQIIEPADVAKAAHGDWRGAARAVAQEADFLARGLVSPYSTLTNTINKGQSILGGLRDQALDIKNPGQGAIRYEQRLPGKLQESAIGRQRHPVGLAERLANKVTRP